MTLRIGTCSFTAKGWAAAFYPPRLKAADYLAYYATHFDTLEIDSTFYAAPRESTVDGWYRRTPADFLFSVKTPQSITHENVLKDCAEEMAAFVAVMSRLGEKLGVVLIQLPWFSGNAFRDHSDFLDRLLPFLDTLPAGGRYSLELRNQSWLPHVRPHLAARGIALSLIDHPWMPAPAMLDSLIDPVTAPFSYVRLLGDRKGIEEITTMWDREVVDRSRDIRHWVRLCSRLQKRGVDLFVYINNHYAGFAPASVAKFMEYWRQAEEEGDAATSEM